jgi:hypothetical protein
MRAFSAVNLRYLFYIFIFTHVPQKKPRRKNHRGFLYEKLTELLVQCGSNVNCHSNGSTNHRVVADAKEAHHLNVSRN